MGLLGYWIAGFRMQDKIGVIRIIVNFNGPHFGFAEGNS